jgi:hypothetical protein
VRSLFLLALCSASCFDGPARPRPGDVWISEVVTAGEADWIEIENRTDRPFDLDGAWISDSMGKPMRHQLESRDPLLLAPHGHLVLTADSDTDRGPLHLPFSLSKSGEPVLLSTRDGTRIDAVTVPPMKSGQSFARIGDEMTLCGTPTPGAINACGEQPNVISD